MKEKSIGFLNRFFHYFIRICVLLLLLIICETLIKCLTSYNTNLIKQLLYTSKQNIRIGLIFIIIISIISIHIERLFRTRKKYANKLREENELARAIINKANIMLVIIDYDNRIVTMNELAEKISGYKLDEVNGEYFWDVFVLPDDIELFKVQLDELKKSGYIGKGVNNFKKKDGTISLVSWTSSAICDDGRIKNIIYTATDVSESQKTVGDALLETHYRFQTLVEQATDGIVIVQDGIYKYLNTPICDITGYRKEELIGKPLEILIADEEKVNVLDIHKRRIKCEDAPSIYESIGLRKNGTEFSIEINAKKINYLGRPAVMAIIRDITARKKIEEQIIHQAYLLDNVGDAVISTDENFIINTWNKSAERIYGYSREEVIGRVASDILKTEFIGADRPTFIEAFIKSGYYQGEVIQFHKDGSPINIELVALALKDEKNRTTEYVSVYRDITERKKFIEALRESEEKYCLLFENATDIIIYFDTELKIRNISPSAKNISGYTIEELVNRKVDELGIISPKSLNLAFSNLSKAMNGEIVPPDDYELIDKDGTTKILEIGGAPIAKDGKIIGAIAIARDITEWQKAQNALIESEERYRLYFENTNDVIYSIDQEFKIISVSPSVKGTLGYSPDELIGRNFQELNVLSSDSLVKAVSNTLKVLNGEIIPSFEYEFIAKDGTKKYGEVSGAPLRKNCRIIGVVSVARDITTRKKMEEELKKNEQKFRTIFNSVNDSIYIYDLEGKMLDVNQFACRHLGYTRRKLLSLNRLNINAEEYSDYINNRIDEVKKNGYAIYETVHIRSDGKKIPVEINNKNINYNGKPAILSIARDITERKLAEDSLKQSIEVLQKTMEGTINVIAKIVETRDPYTAGHQNRVAKLACAIAKAMGLSEEQTSKIHIASVIHDLGKIYVPAEILAKPGKLTDIEFNIIKTHPQIGYDILSTIEFPAPIALIVLQHHERINGTGYPSGLKGDEIVLEARILGVADVVEAMSSHRPYRAVLGVDKALEEIYQNRDILYDSDVVDLCINIFKNKNFSFD